MHSLYLFLLSLPAALAIWPAPQSLTTGDSVIWMDLHDPGYYFEIFYKEGNEVRILDSAARSQGEHAYPQQSTFLSSRDTEDPKSSTEEIVDAAIWRACYSLFNKTPVPWRLLPRNKLVDFEPTSDEEGNKYFTRLTINQDEPRDDFKPLAGQVDESYNLTLTADGEATIDAVTYLGVLHGLQTFTQLFYQHTNGDIYTKLAPVAIVDAPKFQHRGLNLDVARNWYPLESIFSTISALSWNKFNRLHLHMTDSQSWPIDIPRLPELSEKGAYQRGLSYTPDDIAEIQAFGVDRGVQVIIEFDMPGHTTAIGLAYPELIAAFDAKPTDYYCAEEPCGTLKLNNSGVTDFLQALFYDVLPRVRPFSSYFHTGGDEVNKNSYLLDPGVKSNDFKTIQPLIQRFVDRNHDQIREFGITPIVWEEMLLEWKLDMGKDVVVQAWLSDESVAQIAAKGHQVIAGNYHFWYLDCGKGQWRDFSNGKSFQEAYPFEDYCSPTKNWHLIYSYDPLAGVPAKDHYLVIGGEVHMWSELTDHLNLEDQLWPRASAAGEVLWSGRQDSNGQNRSQVEASPRLAEMRERMISRGMRFGPVQMTFCTQSKDCFV